LRAEKKKHLPFWKTNSPKASDKCTRSEEKNHLFGKQTRKAFPQMYELRQKKGEQSRKTFQQMYALKKKTSSLFENKLVKISHEYTSSKTEKKKLSEKTSKTKFKLGLRNTEFTSILLCRKERTHKLHFSFSFAEKLKTMISWIS
jgi:hypothetical protein